MNLIYLDSVFPSNHGCLLDVHQDEINEVLRGLEDDDIHKVFEVGDLNDIVEGDSNVGDNLKIIGIKAKIIDLHLGESGIVLGILQVLVESQCEL